MPKNNKNDPQPWESEREITPGGSEVIRHEAKGDKLNKGGLLSKFLGGKTKFLGEAEMDAVSDHVNTHVGPIESVLHEIVSDELHIDVLYVKPTQEIPYVFLCSMGMCARPMKVPRGDDSPRRAELCILLPPKWPMTQESLKKLGEDAYWPIRWLKTLARLPQDFDTYLAVGHTIPNPAGALSPRCKFTGFLIAPAPFEGFKTCKVGGEDVAFYTIAPLYEEEMQLKLDEGVEALFDRFEQADFGPLDIANPTRPNVAR